MFQKLERSFADEETTMKLFHVNCQLLHGSCDISSYKSERLRF